MRNYKQQVIIDAKLNDSYGIYVQSKVESAKAVQEEVHKQLMINLHRVWPKVTTAEECIANCRMWEE